MSRVRVLEDTDNIAREVIDRATHPDVEAHWRATVWQHTARSERLIKTMVANDREALETKLPAWYAAAADAGHYLDVTRRPGPAPDQDEPDGVEIEREALETSGAPVPSHVFGYAPPSGYAPTGREVAR